MGAHNSSHYENHHEQNENPRHQKRVKHNALGTSYRDYKKENISSRGYQHDTHYEDRQPR